MTDWKDKYKDLEIGQYTWYWTKMGGMWFPVLVSYSFSEKYKDNIVQYHPQGSYPCPVREDYPDGPRCLTPDEEKYND